MLTGGVNIAVFAAFHFCFTRRSVADAVFKPVWPIRQLDIWRYGRQEWQETAKGMAKAARWAAKAARMDAVAATSRLPGPRLRWGAGGLFASLYGVVKVLAARGDATNMELNYHERGEMSRRCAHGRDQRGSLVHARPAKVSCVSSVSASRAIRSLNCSW